MNVCGTYALYTYVCRGTKIKALLKTPCLLKLINDHYLI